MGVKAGYRQTDVGDIPEQWAVKALGEIANLYQPTTISANLFTEDGYPVYGANGVVGHFHSFNHDSWQVTVTCRGSTCGTVNRTVEKCWITGNAMVVNADHSRDVDKAFLYFLLLGSDLTRCITGTGQPQIVRAPLSAIRLAIPPPPEQRAIAEALSDVDALLSGLDRLIAKKRDLKQAAMQQLLTGQTRLPGFHGEWEERQLKQVAEITTGINKPLSEMGSGTLYVTVQDLYAGTSIRTERLSRIKVSPSEVDARSLSAGDIVFGKSSVKREGIGYPSQFMGANEPVVFSGFTYRARARPRVADAAFLFYGLRAEKSRRWVIDNSQASALTNINQAIADAIPVMLPPSVDEQTAIAQILSDMDAELAALETRREKTRQLKQGMMQELLTGRTRLV